MKNNNRMKKIMVVILLMAMLISAFPNISSVYANEESNVSVKSENLSKDAAEYDLGELKSGKSYDLMVGFDSKDERIANLDLRERAKVAQKEALKLLKDFKKKDKTLKYESFYIVNAIHVKTSNKELIERLSKLDFVNRITANGKIHLVEPIKKSRKARSVIFQPDERNIEWGVSLVHGDKVWEDFNLKGEGVTVGIIDTGVNYRIPAIKKQYKGYDPATDTSDPKYYKDFVDGKTEPEADHINDHGTHVAGSIVGEEGENLNRIGVAPGAKYISARVLDDNGGDTAALLAAGQWMLEQKPDIINNSWGGDNSADPWFFEMAQAWREAGILPVFAAGNQVSGEPLPGPGSISNPGNMLNVFSVAAVDINKKIGSFSKKGPSAFDENGNIIKPDISAPGVQVRSVDATGKYVSWNGTSMATPHVVGVAALVKQANRNLGVSELEDILRQTAEPLTDRSYSESPNMSYGYGLINAYDAVAKAKGIERGEIFGKVLKSGEDSEKAKLNIISPDESYAGRDFTFKVEAKDDVSVTQVEITYNINGKKKTAKMTMASGDEKAGVYEFTIDGSELSEGELSAVIKASDFAGNTTEVKKLVKIIGGAKPPVIWDFESEASGFITTGRWGIGEKQSKEEPEPVTGNGKYVAVDVGKNGFKKRTDSYFYLPPVDMEELKKGDKLSLSLDEYKGFTGISLAYIQASTTGKENDWHDLHEVVIRPDQTERRWEHNSYDLSQYVGKGKNLHLRFYFYGHDADEGCGWYLDNIEINRGDNIPPGKVTGLRGLIDEKGVKLSFTSLEDTDLKGYIIERKRIDTSDKTAKFEKLMEISRDEGQKFINVDNEKTHYINEIYDETAEKDGAYEYRVKAVDAFGNEGEYSDVLTIGVKPYVPEIFFDFENEDSLTASATQGDVMDWQRGRPVRPEGDFGYIGNDAWDSLLSREGNFWGTNLNGAFSKNQDSQLVTNAIEINDKTRHLYINSFNTVSQFDPNSFTVEIREEGDGEWYSLFSKEEIQDNRNLRKWTILHKDLKEYLGKRVNIRFHVKTGNSLILETDLGWYIDDVMLGEEKPAFGGVDKNSTTLAMVREMTSDEVLASEAGARNKQWNTPRSFNSARSILANDNVGNRETPTGIPAVAKIKVLETGRYTYSDPRDGSYTIAHAVNQNGPYTIEVSAYGYETQRTIVDLKTEKSAERNFLLKNSKKSKISGFVVDKSGIPISDAYVRVVEDEHYPLVETDKNGKFEIDDIYVGRYTLRAFKDGLMPGELGVKLEEKPLEKVKITLGTKEALKDEVTDYGYNPVEKEGEGYQTIHFLNGMKGSAVAFQAPYENARLKSVQLFLVQNQYYKGENIQLGILSYDDEGRLREIVPFFDVKGEPNKWNDISLEEYDVRQDKPLFVATRYKGGLEDSIGVLYDENADKEAKAKSFIFDGSFIKTENLSVPGAFAMRSTWEYKDGAKRIQADEINEGTSDSNIGFKKPLSEEDFIFDEETGTITGYRGEAIDVKVPVEINGIPVLAIGDNAFDGTGKTSDQKLRSITIPDGVKSIGREAFKNNNLALIRLPESLETIGKGAFKYQYKDGMEDRSLKVNIPSKVKIIEEEVFQGAGSPIEINDMQGVTTIKKNAFGENKSVTLHAPNLKIVEDGAFGRKGQKSLDYGKIYTDNQLESKDGEYLVNPAFVRIKMIDAKDDERVLKNGLIYGPSKPQSYSRSYSPNDFYRVGTVENIAPPDFREDGQLWRSIDNPLKIELKAENNVEFSYYMLAPQIRGPLLDGDDEIVGFSIPNMEMRITVGNEEHKVTSNEDGFFSLKLSHSIKAGETVKITHDEKIILESTVKERSNGLYVIEKGKLLRYLGSEKDVRLPQSSSEGKVISEIGDFAFYGHKLNSVIIGSNIETIGAGAFLDTELKEVKWDIKDMTQLKLRTIKEYAFKDNLLTSLKLGELTHIIQTKAFEDNKIENLELGKYLGHVGKAAFKGNQLVKLEIPGNVEDIGEEAFMNNRLEKVSFTPSPPKSEHGHTLKELQDKVFAGNRIASMVMIDTVESIADNAFEGNTAVAKTDVHSDNLKLVAGKTFNVVRSDGTVLTYGEEDDNSKQDPDDKDTGNGEKDGIKPDENDESGTDVNKGQDNQSADEYTDTKKLQNSKKPVKTSSDYKHDNDQRVKAAKAAKTGDPSWSGFAVLLLISIGALTTIILTKKLRYKE